MLIGPDSLPKEIRLESRRANVSGVMGSSGIFAIIIAPLSLVHIFTNVYVSDVPTFDDYAI